MLKVERDGDVWKGVEVTVSREQNQSSRKYMPLVVLLSVVIYAIIFILYVMPKPQNVAQMDLTFLPMLNAIFNSFTFLFLLLALVYIRKKHVTMHKRFIWAAFATTTLFLLTYTVYHSLAPSTPYGGEGVLRYIYYFILITHIVLAAVIVPIALVTLFRGVFMEVEKHKKLARWTMPLWLYVSLSGVLVYIFISPYY